MLIRKILISAALVFAYGSANAFDFGKWGNVVQQSGALAGSIGGAIGNTSCTSTKCGTPNVLPQTVQKCLSNPATIQKNPNCAGAFFHQQCNPGQRKFSLACQTVANTLGFNYQANNNVRRPQQGRQQVQRGVQQGRQQVQRGVQQGRQQVQHLQQQGRPQVQRGVNAVNQKVQQGRQQAQQLQQHGRQQVQRGVNAVNQKVQHGRQQVQQHYNQLTDDYDFNPQQGGYDDQDDYDVNPQQGGYDDQDDYDVNQQQDDYDDQDDYDAPQDDQGDDAMEVDDQGGYDEQDQDYY